MNLKIGMIGLDTSHVEIFSRLLHENKTIYNQAQVIFGCPSPSEDLYLSESRVNKYTTYLQKTYDVTITNSIKELMEQTDAVMITAVDGRKHLDLFRKVVSYRKPIFIDKPLALTEADAKEIFDLSIKYNTPVMSTSSLRYADSLQKQLSTLIERDEKITGIYISGPLPFIEKIPFYFWYGVHMVEMLITILGPNYKTVQVHGNKYYDVITVEWEDGRFGSIRGSHEWHSHFEAILHTEKESFHLPIYQDEKSYYACLLEEIIKFFETGKNPIPMEETLAIIRLITEANNQRKLI